MNDKKKYTVSEISNICGITPRQLRYYDSVGILQPNCRNPENGYRYYTEDQIEQLIFLTDLKNIGISNDSIHRLFVNRDVDQLVQELQINLTMVEQEIQDSLNHYRSLVNALVTNTRALSYLHGNEAINSEYGNFWISIIQIPKIKILYTRYATQWKEESHQAHLKKVIDLNTLATKGHIKTVGNRMTIFRHGALAQFGDESADAEAGMIEIAKEISSDDTQEYSEHIRTFGDFTALHTIYTGNPAHKRSAYDILFKWARDHNLSVSDTSIEEYMVDFFSAKNKDRFVTKIYLPLEGSEI